MPLKVELKRELDVAYFNTHVPIGTVMEYRTHRKAEPRLVTTTTEAWVLSGHTAVVMVDGVSGCVAIAALDLFGQEG